MNAKAKIVVSLVTAIIVLTAAGVLHAQSDLGGWQKITAIPDAKTHLVPRTWTLDKYPDAPTLTPHSKVTLLDQDGPGVVTNFHVSNYAGGDASQLVLRVWYDRQDKPAIDMPLMDFLGDIQAAAKPYHTIYFSRVRASHNFRLPMPFQVHIRIEVENPTDRYMMGYMEVQWDEIKEFPKESGYLSVVFRQGTFKFPHEDLVLCGIQSSGTIVAHSLQLEGDHPSCANGQGICEANHEIYLDGDKAFPTIAGTGAEDYVGLSYGVQQTPYLFHGANRVTPADGIPDDGLNGEVSMYRWHLPDPIYWHSKIRVTVQQIGFSREQYYAVPGATKNPKDFKEIKNGYKERTDDWSAATFWYEPVPSQPLPLMPGPEARLADLLGPEGSDG